jgi:hypothetical protein
MGWLTDTLNKVAKLDPLGSTLAKTQVKYDSKVVGKAAGALGWTALEREAQANEADPMRGVGRAATATALAYAAWLGYGAYGAAGAGGATAGAGSAAGGAAAGGSNAAWAGLALNAYGAIAARKAAGDVPQARGATYMPDPNDPQAMMARRRKASEIRKRSGRASTILSDTETLG